MQDITEHKRVVDALLESEARLAEAQRIAHLGSWHWDIITNDLYWSDGIYRIFGLSPQEFGATFDAFLKTLHPEDVAFVKRAVDDALYHNQPYNIEHRIVLPNGEVRVVNERAEVTFDEDGTPIKMIGTVHDITEQWKARNVLEEKARDEIHGFLASALPVFASNVPRQARDMLVSTFADRFEKNIKPRFIEDVGKVVKGSDDHFEVFKAFMIWLTGYFANFGVSVERAQMDNMGFLRLMGCPWYKGARENPIFCLICRTMVYRSFTWTEVEGIVSQHSSMANGAKSCDFEFRIRSKLDTEGEEE
jgi:PAS domain S-box-containing protein